MYTASQYDALIGEICNTKTSKILFNCIADVWWNIKAGFDQLCGVGEVDILVDYYRAALSECKELVFNE